MQGGIAAVAYFGPEAEFFVFDHLAYEQREHRAFYEIDSSEGFWNTGEVGTPGPNLAYKLRQKEGYFPVPPADSLANLRSEMVMVMESLPSPVFTVVLQSARVLTTLTLSLPAQVFRLTPPAKLPFVAR